jgi:hypothetical protein
VKDGAGKPHRHILISREGVRGKIATAWQPMITLSDSRASGLDRSSLHTSGSQYVEGTASFGPDESTMRSCLMFGSNDGKSVESLGGIIMCEGSSSYFNGEQQVWTPIHRPIPCFPLFSTHEFYVPGIPSQHLNARPMV